MDNLFEDKTLKTNSQLMAKCEYDSSTGSICYMNFEKYYGTVVL